MSDVTTLGQRLRAIRGARTQKEFAGVMGVAEPTYKNYERDRRSPDAFALAPLAQAGWSAHWLLTGEGPERLESAVDKGLQAQSQPAGLSPSNVQAAAGAIAAVVAHLGLNAKPSAIARAVVALAADLDRRGVAKAQVEDLLEAAKAHLTTGSTEDGRSE